jgi:hypothetical protein
MKLGKRKCKNCGEEFQKERPLQSVCCFNCAAEQLLTKQKKDNAQAWKVKKARLKESLKTLGEYKKDLQIIFNKFIRLRDAKEPCISCQNKTLKKVNAGHYKSVGAHPELRYSELNVHLQCEYCNTHLHGNLIEYRKGLINRIGLKETELLEAHHEPKNYTKQDILDLMKVYKLKIKQIENNI